MGQNVQHILIAEDDPNLGSIVQFNIERAGFAATLARDGQEAWELAQNALFDLVLTDYGMPKMMGTDLCRQLRQDRRYVSTPIILMTAYGRDLNLTSLEEELDISAVYAKPFSPCDLVSTIQELLAAVG